MEKVILGKSSVRVSPIAMGTWQAGKSLWVGVNDRDVVEAIEASLTGGITTFDTAEEYGDGESERLLGKTLKSRRDQVQILTKVFSHHLKADDVRRACETSLKNLETDYLDLYQIHWPSGSWDSEVVPIGETMEALTRLKNEGKVRAIGVSNFTRGQLEEAMQYGTVDTLQSPYSLLWRHLDRDLLPFTKKHSITVLAYSPLAHGILAGKVQPAAAFERGDNRKKVKLLAPDAYDATRAAVTKLSRIAEARGMSLAALALAWIRHRGVIAIAGARRAEQAAQNAQALHQALDHATIGEVESAVQNVADRFAEDSLPWQWNP